MYLSNHCVVVESDDLWKNVSERMYARDTTISTLILLLCTYVYVYSTGLLYYVVNVLITIDINW
jgi:hypothetical protein